MEQKTNERGLLRRTTAAVRRLFGRRARQEQTVQAAEPEHARPRRSKPSSHHTTGTAGRAPRREADIPLDVVASAYTPAATSSKASFRSDGADHQLDQEFAAGVADNRWKDEDRYTNHSGDPRIGTHGRTYEPGESGNARK